MNESWVYITFYKIATLREELVIGYLLENWHTTVLHRKLKELAAEITVFMTIPIHVPEIDIEIKNILQDETVLEIIGVCEDATIHKLFTQ